MSRGTRLRPCSHAPAEDETEQEPKSLSRAQPRALSRQLRLATPREFSISQRDAEGQLRRLPFSFQSIRQAIWLYLRFTVSLRDVEDLPRAKES